MVIFTFFYTLVIFQQQNLAENLQRNGGFIPGIRPGRPTQEYLNRVIIRITWGGALFLGIIAIIPYFVTQATDVRALTLSSTSLLIMVGVALDTMRQLEAQLLDAQLRRVHQVRPYAQPSFRHEGPESLRESVRVRVKNDKLQDERTGERSYVVPRKPRIHISQDRKQ